MLIPSIPLTANWLCIHALQHERWRLLETHKWAHVLQGLGHQVFYFAGLCDRPPEVESTWCLRHTSTTPKFGRS